MIKLIEEFLELKPGYVKEGAERLKRIIDKQLDIEVTKEECRQAVRNMRARQVAKTEVPEEDLKILFYDIETSYNILSSWRTGNKVSLPHYSVIKERAVICVSYKWGHEDEVYTLTWDKNQDDKFLLEQFFEVMNEADVLVAHNGNRFDFKWLKGRAIKHEDIEILPFYTLVDTLKISRKHLNLNSHKLDYLSSYFGFGHKIKVDHELWDNIILHKDDKALTQMVEYCEEDVVLLEKVYNKLKRLEASPQHVGVNKFNANESSPYTGSMDLEWIKSRTTSAGTVKHIIKDKTVNRMFEMTDAKYRKYLKNKQ